MTESVENVPSYRKIRITAPEEPVAVVADLEAWQARDKYPDILSAGDPVFGLVREREAGGWEVLGPFCNRYPQMSRDDLGPEFRDLAQRVKAENGDTAGHDEAMAAAERLEGEALDELTVLGVRYRVIRAECFIRSGPDGPEPPRPSDADALRAGESFGAPDPSEGFVIDPASPTGMSEGILKTELLGLVRPVGSVPEDVRHDSLLAARTHPGGVLMPAAFMTSERIGGVWRPDSTVCYATPQSARDGIADRLRVMIPWEEKLSPAEREPYNEAADRIDAQRCDELEVAGRRFRIVRVERLVRIGPDGPEPPRPSDPDPCPPVLVQNQQLRDAGVNVEEEDAKPLELSEDTRRLMALCDEDEERRKERQKGQRKRGRR
ncbi:DUF5954 family protein [Streptomyces sp. LP05-1]|uniref:DUF5954 family protein n=1 Tax=Streptomyces pyxinae TaxID=2970734 RepID=A0ABT2CMD1_9ACTN|nr:DUF5954 family protein [Streptomyces sp. LP05-1]MCS0638421.1 DUF5954 family protein [Streptomyces sp. LP05-1]